MVSYQSKEWRLKKRQIQKAFVETGATPGELARMFGVYKTTAAGLCVTAMRSEDVGDAPELCRKGIFAGFKDIIEPILRKHGIRWVQIMGRNRVSVMVKCRWEIWTALNDAGKPYIRIGQFFGRHHTTIWHGCERYRGLHVKEENLSGSSTERSAESTGESSRAA